MAELRGTISRAESAPDGWVVADAEVVAEGRGGRAFRFRRPFVLTNADGEDVHVAPADAALIGGATKTSRGPWGKVSRTPIAALLRGYQAGPQVPVRVDIRGFRVGDSIRVEGTATTGAPERQGGYREARAGVMRCDATSIGPGDASGTTARATPGERFELARAAGLMAAVGLALAALWLAPWSTLLGASVGGSWLSFALVLAWRLLARWLGHAHFGAGALTWRYLPEFREPVGGEETRRVHSAVYSRALLALFAVVAGSLPWGLRFTLGGGHEWGLGITAVAFACGPTLWLLVDHWWVTRIDRRVARSMLAASPRASGERWRATEGTLLPAPADLERRVTSVVHVDGIGRARRQLAVVTEVATGPEEVRVRADDAEREIAIAGATWACGRSERAWHNSSDVTCRFTGSSGDRVLAAANDESERLRARGPESLLLYVTPGDPRAELRRALQLSGVGWVLPLVGALAAACLYAITS